MRCSRKGQRKSRPNVMVGSAIAGQKISETSYGPRCRYTGGMMRNAPSIHPMYQSGCAAVVTADGENGPYNHTGLICARPPSSASTPEMTAKSPTLFAAYVGHSLEPTAW